MLLQRYSTIKDTESLLISGQSGNCSLLRSRPPTYFHVSNRIITYMLLCGYTPFRSDDMKELVRQTTEARINFHDLYWKNVSDEGMVS